MDLLALIFPKEKKFYRMIEEQVQVVGIGVDKFYTLISKFDKLSSSKRNDLTRFVSKTEHTNDKLYSEMVQALKSTFITPMDREDIHQLVMIFENLIDDLECLAFKVDAFNIKKMDKRFVEQTAILKEMYELTEKLIFSIKDESQAEKICCEIRKLENKADDVYMKALKNLFIDSMTPMDVIKLKDLYSSTEKMVDSLKQACLIIENLVVKYS